MSVTGSTIITNALKEINIIGALSTATAAQLERGRQRINRMLDLWKVRSIFVYAVDHETYTWTTSRTVYSIGPTGNFVAARPVKIERANLIRVSTDPDQHVPLIVQEIGEFADIPYRAYDGEEPTHIYYQPTVPNGNIYPWPYPEDTAAALANQLELFMWYQIATITDVDTSIDLPYGYEEAITLSLAELLCISYEKSISAELARFAREARALIASANIKSGKISTRDYGVPQSESY